MKSIVTLFTALLTSSAFAEETIPNTLTEEERADGWILLFDGKNASQNFRGYKQAALPEQWVIEAGTISLKGTNGGDVITKDQYESFKFQVEWKIAKNGNSGIMFKVLETDGPSYKTGPEAQILDGEEPKGQKSGWLYELYSTDKDTSKPAGEWNHFVLECQKTASGTYRCEHLLNGEKYVEYEIGSDDWKEKVAKSKFATWEQFGTASAGHICFQDHGPEVAFRNGKIKVLEPLK